MLLVSVPVRRAPTTISVWQALRFSYSYGYLFPKDVVKYFFRRAFVTHEAANVQSVLLDSFGLDQPTLATHTVAECIHNRNKGAHGRMCLLKAKERFTGIIWMVEDCGSSGVVFPNGIINEKIAPGVGTSTRGVLYQITPLSKKAANLWPWGVLSSKAFHSASATLLDTS